jgi:hypothetical protein
MILVPYGLGPAGWFGRPVENPSPVFGLLVPNSALRASENPRVDDSKRVPGITGGLSVGIDGFADVAMTPTKQE